MRDSKAAYQKFEEALPIFLATGCLQGDPQPSVAVTKSGGWQRGWLGVVDTSNDLLKWLLA